MPTSNRADRRGHWPAGQTRSDLTPRQLRDWESRLRPKLQRILANPPLGPVRADEDASLRPSRRSLAVVLGVNMKTVCRWVNGERTPMAVHYKAMRRWVEQVQ